MRPQFIRLFNLLLTLSLLLAGIGWTAAPSAARPLKVAVGPETPVRVPAAPHDLVPLPRDCGGTTPPACCAYGYVIRNGRALDGVPVTVQSASGQVTVITGPGPTITDPYFHVDLSSSPLNVQAGDWVTLTVQYDGYVATERYGARLGGNQMDIVLGQKVWDTADDFRNGILDHTEVVHGMDEITLLRRWATNVRIDNAPLGYQRFPSLVKSADGTLYTVWADYRNGNYDIYFARSTDGGKTWGPNLGVNDPASGDQSNPFLLIGADGKLYVVWQDNRNGDWDIYSARSEDGGMTWSRNVRVDSASSDQQSRPSLAIGKDGTLYAVWEDSRNGSYDIYFARSTDGGTTWSTNVRVDDAPFSGQYTPSIAAYNGMLYIAWADGRYGGGIYHIYFSRSSDGGTTWSTNIRIDGASSGSQKFPSLAVGADGTLYVAWEDSRNGDYDIYFARSADMGVTWTPNVRVDNAPSGNQEDPSLAVGTDGTLYVAWKDSRNGDDDIYFAYSTDGGETWSSNIRVDDASSGDQSSPSLAAGAGGTPCMAWEDSRRSNYDIFFSCWPTTNVYTGTYVSPSYDAGSYVNWNTLAYTATIPNGTSVVLATRTGNTPVPDTSWSDWVALPGSPADLSMLPATRYFQWRAFLSSPISTTTPSLDTVVLTFLPADVSVLQVSPASLTFEATQGGSNPAAQALNITNGGTGTLTWTASENLAWLSLSSISGTTPSTVNVSVDITGLSAGTYTGDIVITAVGAQGSPQTMPVTLTVRTISATPWTFMLYLDGDYSDIYPFLTRAVQALESLPANPNLNLVVLFDGDRNHDGWRFLVQPGGNYTLGVNKWYEDEPNMGDPGKLAEFILWARERYPAQHYYLSIADHGRGTEGIAYDQTDHDYLTTDELRTALHLATSGGQWKIDVLHYDACLMAMLENAYQVKDYADYLIASENLGWAVFAYNTYAQLGAHNVRAADAVATVAARISTATTPRQLAIDIADAYFYHPDLESYPRTISVMDLGQATAVRQAVDDLAAAMGPRLDSIKDNIATARLVTQKFDSRDYYKITDDDEYLDLYDLARRLKQSISDSAVQTAAQGVMDAVTGGFVVVEHHQSGLFFQTPWDLDDAHGVSIYFPPRPGPGDYDRYINHQLFLFTFDGGWDEFLADYFGKQVLPPERPTEPGLPPMLFPQFKVYLPLVIR